MTCVNIPSRRGPDASTFSGKMITGTRDDLSKCFVRDLRTRPPISHLRPAAISETPSLWARSKILRTICPSTTKVLEFMRYSASLVSQPSTLVACKKTTSSSPSVRRAKRRSISEKLGSLAFVTYSNFPTPITDLLRGCCRIDKMNVNPGPFLWWMPGA